MERKIIEFIQRRSGVRPSEVVLGAELVGDLGMDSLDMVELLMDTEEEFDIDIPDECVEDVVTVSDAIAAVRNLL